MTNINIGMASDFSYGRMEQALAAVLKVPDAKRSAFAARLRHLRKLGVPAYEPKGSGAPLRYSKLHGRQMLIALLLQSIGCSPRLAAKGARLVTQAATPTGASLLLLPGEKFEVITAEERAGIMDRELCSAMLDLDRCIRALEHALLGHRQTRAEG